jgi:hypothetical protein
MKVQLVTLCGCTKDVELPEPLPPLYRVYYMQHTPELYLTPPVKILPDGVHERLFNLEHWRDSEGDRYIYREIDELTKMKEQLEETKSELKHEKANVAFARLARDFAQTALYQYINTTLWQRIKFLFTGRL